MDHYYNNACDCFDFDLGVYDVHCIECGCAYKISGIDYSSSYLCPSCAEEARDLED